MRQSRYRDRHAYLALQRWYRFFNQCGVVLLFKGSTGEVLDAVFKDTLGDLMTDSFKGRNCHLLLSANLKASRIRITAYAQSIGCKVYIAPRQVVGKNVSEDARFGFGINDLIDIHLLTRSHFFLGTVGSAVSLFILGRVASQIPPTYDGSFFKLLKLNGKELVGHSHLCKE